MKHKLLALATLAMLNIPSDGNNVPEIKNEQDFKAIIIEQLINLEQTLSKDEKSLKLVKKYTSYSELYNEKTREDIRSLCNGLGIQEEWFYKLINLESNGNPAAVNKYSGATGLIQFMPATAKALGTSTEDLKKMSVSEQLYWVDLYLSRVKKDNSYDSLLDLYFAVFYPKGIGKSETYVIGSEKGIDYAKTVHKQNKGIDKAGNNDGLLTKSDIAAWIS